MRGLKAPCFKSANRKQINLSGSICSFAAPTATAQVPIRVDVESINIYEDLAASGVDGYLVADVFESGWDIYAGLLVKKAVGGVLVSIKVFSDSNVSVQNSLFTTKGVIEHILRTSKQSFAEFESSDIKYPMSESDISIASGQWYSFEEGNAKTGLKQYFVTPIAEQTLLAIVFSKHDFISHQKPNLKMTIDETNKAIIQDFMKSVKLTLSVSALNEREAAQSAA